MLLVLAFTGHVVWTPVHLAISHGVEVALTLTDGQHAHAFDPRHPVHAHHDHGGGHPGDEAGHEHEGDPDHDHHAADHLIELLAVRKNAESKVTLALPEAGPSAAPPALCVRTVRVELRAPVPRTVPPHPAPRGPPHA